MSLVKWILIIALILIAIAHFAPGVYDSGQEWVTDQVGDTAGEGVASAVDTITDITIETGGENDGS